MINSIENSNFQDFGRKINFNGSILDKYLREFMLRESFPGIGTQISVFFRKMYAKSSMRGYVLGNPKVFTH